MYRLGIDLGTASVAVVALHLNEQKDPTDVLWHMDRLFSEPTEKGTTGREPKRAARRKARLQRKQIDRRARRLRRIAHLAPLLGLIPSEVPADAGQHLIKVRADAARQKVELADFLRVLLKLAKRRGYKGEFRTKGDDEAGQVQGGSQKLAEAMQALAQSLGRDSITVGEFLYHGRHLKGLPVRLKLDRDEADMPNLYALRGMIEQEFDQIWTEQAQHHAVLNGQHQGRPIKELFREAIFYQRPLKSVAGMVGNCGLETNLPRASRAQMAAQAFRIEKQLSDLRWGVGKHAVPLTDPQKAVIRQLLNEKKEVPFKTILKELEKAGVSGPVGKALNMDRASREELHGNSTLAAFRKMGLETDWLELDALTQVQVINFLADLGSPEALGSSDWPQNFDRKFSPAFIAFINKMLESGEFDRLAKMGFDSGRSSYSIKALNKLSHWLQSPKWPADWTGERRVDEEAAIRQCYPALQAAQQVGLEPRLPAHAPTGNDVVDVALRQLRWVINQAIAELGETPAEIIVEMAREVGVGVGKRNEWEAKSAKNQKARKAAAKRIADSGFTVTSARLLRFQLHEEQGSYCPYCAQRIEFTQAMDGNETNFEHILPRNLTQVGRKRSELLLAHRDCNDKKKDQTPWQAFGHTDRWPVIEERAKFLEAQGKKFYGRDRGKAMALFRKAKLLLLKDYEEEVLTDESIANFADRQFHQTSWIAKLAAQWLRRICPDVSVSRGEMTAQLRRAWRLETVIPEVRIEEGYPVLDIDQNVISPEEFALYRKQWEGHRPGKDEPRTDRVLDKRLDHRHHLIDALTIGLTSRSVYQAMAREFKKREEQRKQGFPIKEVFGVEPPMRNVREQALALIRQARISHKPDQHPSGKLFDARAYGTQVNDDSIRLISRYSLADLADANGDLSKTRKKLSKIASNDTRRIIEKEFEARLASGEDVKKALSRPISDHRYGTEIWRVRLLGESAESVKTVIHASRSGQLSKKLVPDGYACLRYHVADGKLTESPKLITAADYYTEQRSIAATYLFKGDIVLDSKDGRRYRVAYFKAEGNIHVVPETEPRAFDEIKEAGSGKKKISFGQVHRLTVCK
ncbi:MAG: type II CRISPR RNA-guided endonuclease Cas9 [Pseudomonadota bacterium]